MKKKVSRRHGSPQLRSIRFAIPGLTIFASGRMTQGEPYLHVRTEALEGYLFFFFHDEAMVEEEGHLRTCPAGSMIVYTPEAVRKYGHTEKPWRHSWLHTGGAFMQRLIASCGLPLNRAILPPDPLMNEKYLSELLNELTWHSEPDRFIVRNIIENWLRDLTRSLEHPEEKAVPSACVQAKRHMERFFQERLTLRQLADHVNMSPSYFGSMFKQYTGISPIEYLIELRMTHALYLLPNRDYNVSRVAAEVGYENARHFSALFKKHFGVSPTRMRRMPPRRGKNEIEALVQRAVPLLVSGAYSIAEVGEQLGFSDPEQFILVFTRHYGFSPADLIQSGLEADALSRRKGRPRNHGS